MIKKEAVISKGPTTATGEPVAAAADAAPNGDKGAEAKVKEEGGEAKAADDEGAQRTGQGGDQSGGAEIADGQIREDEEEAKEKEVEAKVGLRAWGSGQAHS